MKKKTINLALQGGGAHGAFTWGVLDRLLEDEDLEIAAISGTSAGALNGAALKAGLVTGGRDAARENLDWLWQQMGALSGPGYFDWMIALAPGAATMSKLIEQSPLYQGADIATRLFNPAALGPFYKNPLERIARRFKYDKICADRGPRLYVCATNVRSGHIRVFSGDEISADALLASTCLPTVFQTVQFADPKTGKKEAFWDGGYTGNPALFPLYDLDLPNDIVVVNINPIYRADVPQTAIDVENRINEVSFNAAFFGELRAIAFVKRLISEGRLKEGQMKDVRVHMIADDKLMNDLSAATKMVPVPTLLNQLKAAGRVAADQFMADHRQDLNERDTVDLAALVG